MKTPTTLGIAVDRLRDASLALYLTPGAGTQTELFPGWNYDPDSDSTTHMQIRRAAACILAPGKTPDEGDRCSRADLAALVRYIADMLETSL